MTASASGMCWMCDPQQYGYVTLGRTRVSRIVDENGTCYVVVPQSSHMRHHLLVVLKSANGRHKRGIIECTSADITSMGNRIAAWCEVLRHMGYDTVYTGCYSDSGHVHFHLIPFHFKAEKGFEGRALQWLAEREKTSDEKLFSNLNQEQKESRVKEIEQLVAELLAAKKMAGNTI